MRLFKWIKEARTVRTAQAELPASPMPDIETVLQRGNAHLNLEEFAAAADCYSSVIKLQPENTGALIGLAFVYKQQGLAPAATACLKTVLALKPDDADAHYMLGTLHEAGGNPSLAVSHFSRAVELAPGFDLAARDLAGALFKSGRSKEALLALNAAVSRNPAFADYHSFLGNIRLSEGDPAQAASHYVRALEIDPTHIGAKIHLGMAQEQSGQLQRARETFAGATSAAPGLALAHQLLANVDLKLGRLALAVVGYQTSLALDPSDANVASRLSHALRLGGRLEEALTVCRSALDSDRSSAEAHNNMGNVLVDLGRADEAVLCYERAVEIRPGFADALVNMGQAFCVLQQPQKAISVFEQALSADGGASWLYGSWLHTRMRICDWRGIQAAFLELARRVDRGDRAATPWTVLATPLTAAQQQRCAETYVQAMGFPEAAKSRASDRRDKRIRLGYFSSDFHEHATAYLMAQLFELHDRSRFEVIGFSFGPLSRSPMRSRLEAAFDDFQHVADMTDAQIADHARSMPVDIAIDLKGFTEGCRTAIFAYGTAPVQVSFMGFPGTMGASFIDYLMADSTVVPEIDAGAYTEKLIWLPHSYQINDSKRVISSESVTREGAGLPVDGFVFACFNNNYKITPDIFDVWMDLLKATPGSVLWLLEDNVHASRNLRAEAVRRGVSDGRLIFAPRVEMPAHLARHRLADLFLDTLYCNAHTSASDALWAGVPLLTCLGATFAGRVAGSLLRAAGLPELVVDTLDDYRRVALELSANVSKLQIVRRRLAENLINCPLFDTPKLTRHIEAAYESIWRRQVAGLAPDHVQIPA